MGKYTRKKSEGKNGYTPSQTHSREGMPGLHELRGGGAEMGQFW